MKLSCGFWRQLCRYGVWAAPPGWLGRRSRPVTAWPPRHTQRQLHRCLCQPRSPPCVPPPRPSTPQPAGSRAERVRMIAGVLELLRELEAGPGPQSEGGGGPLWALELFSSLFSSLWALDLAHALGSTASAAHCGLRRSCGFTHLVRAPPPRRRPHHAAGERPGGV